MQGRKSAAPKAAPLGRAAFQAHFARIAPAIVVGEDTPEAREVAHAVGRARQWAQAGDYLAAIHAIAGLELRLSRPGGEQRPGALSAADVEEALGEIRRDIERVGEAPGAAEAAQLWQAAREEVVRGSWEAAMALLAEAREWLDRGK